MSDKKFYNPEVCPYCGSYSIAGISHAEYDADYAWREVECIVCEKSWKELFTLAGAELEDKSVLPTKDHSKTKLASATEARIRGILEQLKDFCEEEDDG